MNQKFVVIISIATFLLIALLIALSAFRSKPQPNEVVPDQVVLPTSIPNKFVSTTLPTLPKQKQDALLAIQNKLPFSSDALEIDYSDLTNKIYVQEKKENAAADLVKFLEDNQLSEVYKLNPELFVITKTDIKALIIDEEQKLTMDLETSEESEFLPTPINSNPEEAKVEKQLNIFKGLFNLGMAGNIIGVTPRPTNPASTSSDQSTAPVGNFQNGFPVTPADTTKISCPTSPTVSEIGNRRIFSSSTGFYSIKLCKVHGYAINSVKAKDFDNMYTAMKAAGYSFKGSQGNFRSYETQLAMHQRNPNGSAPAGGSNHEKGLAVDTSCSNADGAQAFKPWMSGKKRGLADFTRAIAEHPCLRWIHNNASKYGLLLQCDGKGKYGEIAVKTGGCETWHLSPTGH